tara:strand:+ start:1997 stop:2425 length:429 start_codon:yes stop_codon:yes gene_type:complete
MSKLKYTLLRITTVGFALFVAMLSMGFTYNWEVCLDADETIICKAEKEKGACSCVEIPVCSCSDKNHDTCDLSFSQHVQFDFEVLINKFQIRIPHFIFLNTTNFDAPTEAYVITNLYPFSNYSIPPPKSGRTILCTIQTLII